MNRSVYKVLIMALAAAILLSFVGCSKTKAPTAEDKAKEFLDLMASQQYEAMYGLLTQDSMEAISEEDFINRYSKILSGIGTEKIQYTLLPDQKEEYQDYEVIPYSIVLTTNTVGDIKFQNSITVVEQEEEGWKIHWDHYYIFPDLTKDDTVRVSKAAPERGNIFDRNDHPLATKGSAMEVGVVTGQIEDEEALLQQLSNLLDVEPDFIKDKYTASWVQPDWFVPIKALPDANVGLIEQLASIPGVSVKQTELRVYPLGSALGQVIGHIGEITAEQLETKKSEGYRQGDLIGQSGLEARYEDVLFGKPGYEINIMDADGEIKHTVAKVEKEDGKDIHLTIDASIQRAAAEALDGHVGSTMVLNPRTGEILAMASSPSYDPNLFSHGITPAQWQALQDDENKPMLNRNIQGLYPPASTIKPLVGAMALDAGVIDQNTQVDSPNGKWQLSDKWGNYYVNRIDRPAGPVNLADATVWSDNIYFAQAAIKMGAQKFIRYMEKLGFGQQLPFDLNVAKSSISQNTITDDSILLADSGYGQGEILTTPLQMAVTYTALINDGNMLKPILMLDDANNNAQAQVLQEGIFTPETVDIIRDALVDTVNRPKAFAQGAKLDDILVAGKTGTGQVGKEGNIGWFIGYAPADNPKYLVCTVVEDTQSGGASSVPITKNIMEQLFK
ncbi:MAG: penicillin-binding transpeptidase domain-containing protein [Mahellales bacterium]